MTDFKEAMRDPAGVFNKPRFVLTDDSLTHEQKHSILLEWEQDAQALLRAGDENMAVDESDMLSRVHRALENLKAQAK